MAESRCRNLRELWGSLTPCPTPKGLSNAVLRGRRSRAHRPLAIAAQTPRRKTEMANIRRTKTRLVEIKRRQWEQRWGASYIAGVFADRVEAPGISSGTTLMPRKLGRRDFHVMSDAELFVALLALYHPRCWDIHEQFVMFPKAREHPLQNHPRAVGKKFQPFVGTLEVFQRLGLKRHQSIRIAVDPDGTSQSVPFPYFGDLRIFMEDEAGPYCVNWPVKRKFADFRGRGPRSKPRRRDDPDDPASIARQEFEKAYHEDAGIRTQPVSFDQLNTEVRLNLRNTFLDECRKLSLTDGQRRDALGVATEHIDVDVPVCVVARRMAAAVGCSDKEACWLIHQAVWRRELRVDLFRPVLTTKPLRAEARDVLDVYSSWFTR